MYTVTFYSFKGGVGRTMTLVNVGYELAKTGRRVLLVDMDLEAPGLDTFNLARPKEPTPGMVDFVTQFRHTGEAPDVSGYMFKSPLDPGASGELWIMPAGLQDDAYDQKLNSINWQTLYAREDGYLLFEDLKAQWRDLLQPDYILIDSRTGHTDVSGICTRQLPDAVVVFFAPNEQNRRGLEKVVRDIRTEPRGEQKKPTELHFVMANVPDLDDEDQILADNLKKMRASLSFTELSGTIYHYDSLSLLNQIVFTASRPRSRLAEQYRKLMRVIVRRNSDDREGALDFLSELARAGRSRRFAPAAVEEQLAAIRSRHSGDGEILFRIAQIYRRQRKIDEALSLADQAISVGFADVEALLFRAEMNTAKGNRSVALEDVKKIVQSGGGNYIELSAAIRLLLDLDSRLASMIPASPNFSILEPPDRLQIADQLMVSYETLPTAELILRELEEAKSDLRGLVHNQLVLCLIGQEKFPAAKNLISPNEPIPGESDTSEVFNWAMADWGETGSLRRELLSQLAARDASSFTNPNHKQCAALALWAAGNVDGALLMIARAGQQVLDEGVPLFSCWRYLRVTPETFLKDLERQKEMTSGASVLPLFLERGMRRDSD